MAKIVVDIDESVSRLKELKEDGFLLTELNIIEDLYSNELHIYSVGIDEEDKQIYGALEESTSELF